MLFSAFVAASWLVGWAFSQGRADGGIAPQFPSIPVCVLVFLALWAVLLAATLAIFRLLDASIPAANSSRESGPTNMGRATAFFLRHQFALPLIAIALCWLPYWLIFFPGSLPWDGVRSMNQFITDAALENHHPVLMNALYAGLMTLGRTLRSDNLGLAFIVGFQYMVCAISFALVVRETIQLKAPRWISWAALAFFCLCPTWGLFAQAAFKDTLFNGVFCLYVVALSKVIRSAFPKAGKISCSTWVLFAAASLLLCFVRNNGVYLALATTFALALWLAFTQRRTATQAHVSSSAPVSRASSPLRVAAPALIVLGIVAFAWFGATRALFPAMGVDVREDKEMLSVPLQQTARYLTESPDDVTESERAAIDAIIPIDTLAALYNPDLSDPVKETMRNAKGNMTADQRSAYFAAWATMGIRHPGIYVRATVANTYAYFYPFVIVGQNMDRPVFPLYIQGLPINKTFDVSFVGPQSARDTVISATNAWLETPVVSCIFSPAPYVLAFLLALAYAFSRRRGPALVFAVPFAMLLLTVLAGPLNGHLRYILPLAAALPVLFAYISANCCANSCVHVGASGASDVSDASSASSASGASGMNSCVRADASGASSASGASGMNNCAHTDATNVISASDASGASGASGDGHVGDNVGGRTGEPCIYLHQDNSAARRVEVPRGQGK